jgi:hypothetical protein
VINESWNSGATDYRERFSTSAAKQNITWQYRINQFAAEQYVTIQDWGAVGEIVGAVAILVTLIYLATQVKYARLTTTDFNRNSRVEGIRQINGALIQNDNARVAWFKSVGPMNHQLNSEIADTLDLSFDDAVLVVLQGTNWCFTHWAQYRSLKNPEDTKELQNIIQAFYSENPMKALIVHPLFQGYFDSEFIEWVDQILSGE